MPVGNPLPTSAFSLQVSDAIVTPVYAPVSLINSWDADYNESVSEYDVFMQADSLEVNGKARATMQFGGFLADSTDTGQTTIMAHEAAKDYLLVKVLWDGTNGFTCKARVNTKRLGAKAGPNLAEVMYTFTILPSTITIVALGPAL